MPELTDITEAVSAALDSGWSDAERREAVAWLMEQSGGGADRHPQENWATVHTKTEVVGLVLRPGPLLWVKSELIETVENEFPKAEVLELTQFDDPSYTGDLKALAGRLPFNPDNLDPDEGFSPWGFSYETSTPPVHS